MVDIVFAARILSLATNVPTHAYLLGANLITVCELDALQIEYMFLQGFFSLIVIYIQFAYKAVGKGRVTVYF